ncbi:hypothetical protein ACP4OV_016952 [Aristida adscensionis]
MWRVMQFLQKWFLLLIVCSDILGKISRCHDLSSEGMIGRWNQTSTNISLLMKNVVMKPDDSGGNKIDHFAEYCSNTYRDSVLTGGMATFDVYALPNVNINDRSASRITVVNVDPAYETIQAGWMVNPSVYGDTKTHFFTGWTAKRKGSTVGCWDLRCDGFVPVNYAPITPGDILDTNNSLLKITIKIFKSKDDGDWWLHFGYDNNNLRPVGYWPKSLFTSLVDHANGILWGGYTGSYPGKASPPMGNGQWLSWI